MRRPLPPNFFASKVAPTLAVLGLVVAILGFGTNGNVFSTVRDWVGSWFADQEELDLDALSGLRTGQSLGQFEAALGESRGHRDLRPNLLGVSQRTVFYEEGRYVVVALTTDTGSVTFFSVTAINPNYDLAVPFSEARLGTTASSAVPCMGDSFGSFGASWWTFGRVCTTGAIVGGQTVFVAWNPEGARVNDVIALDAAFHSVARKPSVRRAERLHQARASRACLREVKLNQSFGRALEPPDLRFTLRSCRYGSSHSHEFQTALSRSEAWKAATRRAPFNTYGVLASTDVESLALIVPVLGGGVGPCRGELPTPGGRCVSWI